MGSYLVNPVTLKPFPQQVVQNGQTVGVGALALVPTAASAPTINAPAGVPDRSAFAVRDVDSNATARPITVNGNGALIDGAATAVLSTSGIEAVFVWDTSESPAQWVRVVSPRVFGDDQRAPLAWFSDLQQ